MIDLSKTIEEADFEELAPELALVDRHFTKAQAQHPLRRWEYAMALRALKVWRQSHRTEQVSYDIGGAGSPFTWMSGAQVVDPENTLHEGGERMTLKEFVSCNPKLAGVVFCLSVVEHVDDLDEFLYHLSCLVEPGGLLFLTMDCREDDDHTGDYWPEDNRHFHWMRKRIFTPRLIDGCLIEPATYFGLSILGVRDPRYHGHRVYDYSFASLALVKRA